MIKVWHRTPTVAHHVVALELSQRSDALPVHRPDVQHNTLHATPQNIGIGNVTGRSVVHFQSFGLHLKTVQILLRVRSVHWLQDMLVFEGCNQCSILFCLFYKHIINATDTHIFITQEQDGTPIVCAVLRVPVA